MAIPATRPAHRIRFSRRQQTVSLRDLILRSAAQQRAAIAAGDRESAAAFALVTAQLLDLHLAAVRP